MISLAKFTSHGNTLFLLGFLVALLAGVLNYYLSAYNATIALLMVLIGLVYGLVHWETKDKGKLLNPLYGLLLLSILFPLARAVSEATDILPGIPVRFAFYFLGSLAAPPVLLLVLKQFMDMARK